MMGREEQMLRETVRRLLSEAGMGDVRVAEPRPTPPLSFGELRSSESMGNDGGDDRRKEVRANLPQAGTADTVISSLGIASDTIGLALNWTRYWWSKPINLLFDHTSVLIAVVQYSKAVERLSKFTFMKKDTLSDNEIKDLQFIYETDYYVALTFACISFAAAAGSVAEILGWEPGSVIEGGLKALRIVGSVTYGLSITEAVGMSPADIALRARKIRDFINGPEFDVLKASFDKLSPLLEGKEVQGSIAGFTAWLVTGGADGGKHDVTLFKSILDKGFSNNQRAIIQRWLAGAKTLANKI